MVTNFVTLKCSQASSISGRLLGHHAVGVGQLPHFDGFVKTAADQSPAVWRECNGVDTVLVALQGAIESFDQQAVTRVPYAHALVQGSGCNKFAPWRHGYCCDAIFDDEVQNFSSAFEIPDTHRAIATARCNMLAIPRKVQGINVLLMTGECMADCSRFDIPHLPSIG